MAKNKSNYVDGFVLVVPKSKVNVYRKMAMMGRDIWMKHGALEYKECIGDDINPKGDMGTLTFPKLTRSNKNETVWFSYITFKSRSHRDQVNKKVMAEMKKEGEKYKDMAMPFDPKRMAYGGFKVSVSG